ncbi:hypothetical protein WDW89_22195 [Deltaproteobacteria bacterium TL4]
MKLNSVRSLPLMGVSIFLYLACTAGLTVAADDDYKAKYESKVAENDATIGVIAGVINYVCPKIVEASTGICNPKDPVGSALGIQKQMGDIDELDELGDAELNKDLKSKKILHVNAAMQLYDAVEQFKEHYPLRKVAKEMAKQGKWQEALLNEEMAWQYLVKTASRGIFAKKMVDGE